MLTRKATIMDFAKLTELFDSSDEDWLLRWMTLSRNNPGYLALVTIDKKEIVAYALSQWEDFEVVIAALDMPKENGDKMLEYFENRIVDEYRKDGKEVHSFTIETNPDKEETLKQRGFVTQSIISYKQIRKEGG